MKTNSTLKTTSAAIAAALVLAACGGGGGDSSSAEPISPASTPSSNTPATGIAPKTSVPAASYAVGSFESTAFTMVNAYRAAMGVGMLAQDPILDTAAKAHALYLISNMKSGAINGLSHDEIAGNANFYSETTLSRGQKAGASASEWIGENAASGTSQSADTAASDCIGQALASVYHLAALTNTQETVGFGYEPGDTALPLYVCVSDFGTYTGVAQAPTFSGFSYAGGQQIPTDLVVHSPYSDEAGIALAMRAEATNPAPDVGNPGRPVLVRVNAEYGNTLTVSQFTLTDSSGSVVSARLLVPGGAVAGSTASTVADPNNLLPKGTAVLLPLSPLKANTAYTVSFAGARDGKAVNSAWRFTTNAN